MDAKNFKPVGNRVLLFVFEDDYKKETVTKSGIIVPAVQHDKRRLKFLRCRVERLSDYFKSELDASGGIHRKPDVKEGDVVLVENNYLHYLDDHYAHGNVYDLMGKYIEED